MHRHRTHHWSHHRTHHWSHHRAHWSRPYAYGVFWKPGDIIVFQVSNMAGPIEEDAIWPCAAEACSKFDNHKDWYQLNLGKKTAIMLSMCSAGAWFVFISSESWVAAHSACQADSIEPFCCLSCFFNWQAVRSHFWTEKSAPRQKRFEPQSKTGFRILWPKAGSSTQTV